VESAGSGSLLEQQVREFARDCVRSGLLAEQALYDEVLLAIRSELPETPDPGQVARRWIAEYRDELAADQQSWPDVTDYDRLQHAFAALEAADIAVLQGCEDHWTAKDLLHDRAAAGDPPRGVAWFTPPDVWHAIDEGMLEINVWHASTANVAPGDPLLDEVIAVLEQHGLSAHYDEGRVEVSAHWHRRL
jgi:hypothetical protein